MSDSLQVRLDIISSDINGCIDCGVGSIQAMMVDAYYKTILRQAFSYNIVVNGKIVGNCMIKFGIFKDEDYYCGDPEYCAMDISYLAIDKKYQGNQYGSAALVMLILHVRNWAKQLPIRCLTLNAFNHLVEWYKKCGFVEYPRENDVRFPNCTPMMIDLMDKSKVEVYEYSLIGGQKSE